QPSLLDEEHRGRRLALADGELAFLDRDPVERVDQRVERVGINLRELGREPEEVAQPQALDVALEVLPDRGVDLDDGPEDGLVEAERLDLAARADGRGPVTVLDQSDLAEGVTRPERPERRFLALLAALEGAGRTADDDVEAVRFGALLDDHLAEAERDGLEGLDHEPAGVVGQELEDRDLVEDVRDAHATAPVFSLPAPELASGSPCSTNLVSPGRRDRARFSLPPGSAGTHRRPGAGRRAPRVARSAESSTGWARSPRRASVVREARLAPVARPRRGSSHPLGRKGPPRGPCSRPRTRARGT